MSPQVVVLSLWSFCVFLCYLCLVVCVHYSSLPLSPPSPSLSLPLPPFPGLSLKLTSSHRSFPSSGQADRHSHELCQFQSGQRLRVGLGGWQCTLQLGTTRHHCRHSEKGGSPGYDDSCTRCLAQPPGEQYIIEDAGLIVPFAGTRSLFGLYKPTSSC